MLYDINIIRQKIQAAKLTDEEIKAELNKRGLSEYFQGWNYPISIGVEAQLAKIIQEFPEVRK